MILKSATIALGAALAAVFLPICSSSHANASVVATFSLDPTEITAGQQANVQASFTLTADSGFVHPSFQSGTVTFVSGNGTTDTLQFSAGQIYSLNFTYPTAGTYTPRLYYDIFYSEYLGSVDPANLVSGMETVFTIESTPYFATLQVDAATPLPAALPLFATGLGGLGLLGWRRKRKAQAVA